MNVEKKTVEREVITTVKEDVYVIELNYEQACALQAVLGRVGGSVSKNNPRDVIDPLYGAIHDLGIRYGNPDVEKYAKNIAEGMKVG